MKPKSLPTLYVLVRKALLSTLKVPVALTAIAALQVYGLSSLADPSPEDCRARCVNSSASSLKNQICGDVLIGTWEPTGSAALAKAFKGFESQYDLYRTEASPENGRRFVSSYNDLNRRYRECKTWVDHCYTGACVGSFIPSSSDKDKYDRLIQKAERTLAERKPEAERALAATRTAADGSRGPEAGAEGPGLVTEGTDGSGVDSPGTADPGSTARSGTNSRERERNSSSGGSLSSRDMGNLMSALGTFMAQQNQPKPVMDYSCNGPTPGPGCPPKHACFTNPSSLECRCSEFGPGGEGCGRTVMKPTERNIGTNNIGENFEEPPPPSGNMMEPESQLARHEPSKLKSSAMPAPGGGGGAGLNTNNSAGLAQKKPQRRVGSGSSMPTAQGGGQGFMSAGSVQPRGSAAARGSNAGPGKGGIIKSEYEDPTVQGAKIHYGKMLQAGMESAKRRTAGTTYGVGSKELRPASDNIFKAVSDMYAIKSASLMR